MGLEDKVRAGLHIELQRNHAIGTYQAKRVGSLTTNIIAENPILLWAYIVGVDAGLRNALTIVDYAKLAEILSYGDSPVYGGDRAVP